MQKVLASLALAGVAASGFAWQQQEQEVLSVSAVRFYSPGNATTTIEGVAEVRLARLLSGLGTQARYRFDVAVLDSAGLELQRSDWTRDVPAALLRNRAATALESFTFRAAPGRYRLRVRATPENGAAVERILDVTAWATRPPVSDLLLAVGVRRSESDTAALEPGEIRRAGMIMRTAPLARLSPTEPSLAYYAEVYPWARDTMRGQLRASVVSAAGRQIVQTPARPLEVGPQGGLSRGSLDLTGLPEGEYRLRLTVSLGDSSVVAEAPFAMGSLQSALAMSAPAAATRAEEALVADADETRLDSLYAPLVHILETDERGVYGNLSGEGKRRFLTQFWRRRDPTPQTPDNPRMEQYYRAVTYANETFREGGAGDVPGWRTDRGRVFLRYGEPSERLSRPHAAPRPYEVWKYTRERQRNYIFYDQSGLGNYYLLATNDRSEQGLRNWDAVIRQPGPTFNHNEVRELFNFLGLPLTSVETSP